MPGAAVLGLLTLLAAPGAAAQSAPAEATPQTSIGIFYQPDAPAETRLWRDGDPGEPLTLRGRVTDLAGRPLAGATVEMWQADGAGMVYPDRYRTRLVTDPGGRFAIVTALPGYIEGASGVWGARHIHVVVSHPDHERLVSLMFFHDDPMRPPGQQPLTLFVEQASVDGRTMHFSQIHLRLQ